MRDYTQFVIEHLEEDLIAATAGNVEDPAKAATDILRDVRDILRSAVDFGGLTPESHKRFIEHFNPIFNRISVGPPLQRNEELQALIAAGIVTLAGGPLSTLVLNNSVGRFAVHSTFSDENTLFEGDVLIKAKIDSFLPLDDDSLLNRNLITQGIFRPFINQNYHPGGIDIDRQQHPIKNNGQILRTLWALGNLVEGVNFYTNVLPRPRVNSRALLDAGRCVIDLYQQLSCRNSTNDYSVSAD